MKEEDFILAGGEVLCLEVLMTFHNWIGYIPVIIDEPCLIQT